MTVETAALETHNGRLAVDALRGPLRAQAVIARLQAHSPEERVSLGQDLTGAEKRVRFLRGCLLCAVAAEAGARVTDRAQVLGAFCAEIGVDYADALAEMRVVEHCGEYADERFPALTWGHYRIAAERTALPGDTPEARQMRAQEYLALAADGAEIETPQGTIVRPLGVRELEDRINQDLGKGRYASAGPMESPPPPTDADVPGDETNTEPADRAHCQRWQRAEEVFISALGDQLSPGILHTIVSLAVAFCEQEGGR